MIFKPTRLPEVVLIEPKVIGDERGFFMETWEARKFADAGIDASFVQDNHSRSSRWVLRGLHYQLRHAQGKLVRITEGEVFDVAVDVRRSSPTFGQWVGDYLSADNRRMMWIPPGFAHGFVALSERVEFLYKCTDFYDPASERTLLWNDPRVKVEWPIAQGIQPIVSAKDRGGTPLDTAECYP
ncbi:dTDP-4-dehydrorhamnose 3,5-epimerase [Steroidobacter cummioxidans]|uniref:dTDP-4-dehydrorhamnose 3,5-epimerase n=1 Tax=Steroidobacter cummioxidans TaxID=1803913 RepID=UPI000E317A52|nr:dTDP-4-dehydrorhamnose 3,5-epimerase [Steroidobacter cummioxidans]